MKGNSADPSAHPAWVYVMKDIRYIMLAANGYKKEEQNGSSSLLVVTRGSGRIDMAGTGFRLERGKCYGMPPERYPPSSQGMPAYAVINWLSLPCGRTGPIRERSACGRRAVPCRGRYYAIRSRNVSSMWKLFIDGGMTAMRRLSSTTISGSSNY